MTEADFLLNLNRAISEYTEYVTTTESITVNERRLLMLKMANVGMLYEIIQFYFRDTDMSFDQNLMTTTEIKLVISKLNNIMGTYLDVEL